MSIGRQSRYTSMSLGRMNRYISIVSGIKSSDADAFVTTTDSTVVSSIKAYREGRHGSMAWANRAQFSEATDLFRFRIIQSTTIYTGMIIIDGNDRFEITSVEDIRGRGMYLECLAKRIEAKGS